MAIPASLETFNREFWNQQAARYDMTTQQGCGEYMEAWVDAAKNAGFDQVEHLKKNPGQTQYNTHAIDAFLWAEAFSSSNPLYQACDVIGAAESTDPKNPPKINWGVDEPRYTAADIWHGDSGGGNTGDSVPWLPYDENSFQSLKQILAYDYGRRPQNADFDVSVWAARVFHSAYMGPEPEKKPLGLNAAIQKHRPEWCEALGVPVDTMPTPKGVVVADDENKG